MDQEKAEAIRAYDDSRENSLLGMMRLFYTREMMPLVVILWINGLVALGLMVFSAMRFFRVDTSVRSQIMYAVIFLAAMHLLAMVKIIAWQVINRNSLRRRFQRLELMIEELKPSR